MTAKLVSGRTSWWEPNSVETRIACREPFRTRGALSGGWTYRYPSRRGNLPYDWQCLLTAQWSPGVHMYLVWSYDTPIGWWTAHHGWTLPGESYSVTTTRHQGRLAVAVHNADRLIRDAMAAGVVAS